MRIAVQLQITLAEDGQQGVIEPANRAGRVLVAHPFGDRGGVDRRQKASSSRSDVIPSSSRSPAIQV